MKLFLSSKGLINEELIEKYISFSELRKEILIITTAAQKYKGQNKNNIKLKEKLNYLGFKSNFIDIEYENPESLRETELIVINGGNPYYLLHHLKKSKSDKILKELIANQIPIKGISSGLLILMNNLKIIDILTPEMNTIGLEDKKGLDIIGEVIIPHYDRFIKEGKISIELINKFEKDSSRDLIRLGEYQCMLYTNNSKEIFGDLME